MASAAAIPSWIQAADPAAHMARGMQIGVQIGAQKAEQAFREQQMAEKQAEFQAQLSAEQAAQKFKEQQAARQAQQIAQDQALQQAKFQAAGAMAAEKSKAMMAYQSDIAAGMDPKSAILKHAPRMTGGMAAASSLLRTEQAAKSAQDRLNFQREQATAKAALPPKEATYVPDSEETGPAHWESGGHVTQARATKPTPDISPSERAQTLAALRAERKALMDENPLAGIAQMKLARGKPLSKPEQAAIDELKSIADQEAELLPKLKTGKAPVAATPPGPKSKVARAQEIRAEHPDWSKEQVIKAVHDEFSQK